jgi:hypothetical protein
MAGTIIADFIRTDANQLSLNVGNLTFATINASGLFSNTGVQIINQNGAIGATSVGTTQLQDGAVTNAKISTSANTIPRSSMTSGAVLQVVSTFDTTTATGTTTLYDMVSTTITPIRSTSKILLLAQISWFSPIDHGGLFFVRNSTAIARNSGANYINGTVSASFDNNNYGSNGNASFGVNALMYLDSPSTTSATTYFVRSTTTGGGGTWYYNRARNDSAQAHTSSLILMEIAA